MAAYHLLAFLLLLTLAFVRESLVMGISVALIGFYSSVLLSWFCKKQRKGAGLFYGAVSAGIVLVACGIALVALSFYD